MSKAASQPQQSSAPMLTAEQRTTLTRWRLVLGKQAEQHQLDLGGEVDRHERLPQLLAEAEQQHGQQHDRDRTVQGQHLGERGPGVAWRVHAAGRMRVRGRARRGGAAPLL